VVIRRQLKQRYVRCLESPSWFLRYALRRYIMIEMLRKTISPR
jgi:hypothetical protein